MAAHDNDKFHDRLPNRAEVENAKRICRMAASSEGKDDPATVSLTLGDDDGRTVTLSPALAASVLDVLELVSSGRGFQVIPLDEELTTLQAAHLLNVSRRHLEGLIEQGEIPFYNSEGIRRIRANDLFEYRRKRDASRADALSRLARMDFEKGLL